MSGPVHSSATRLTRSWSSGSPSRNRTLTVVPAGHLNSSSNAALVSPSASLGMATMQ